MELKKYQIGKNNFEFVCESWSNSRAWGHKVTLFKNGYQMQQAKITYYNRTWESYQYQSCMLRTLEQELNEKIQDLKENYKSKNNITRITKKHNEILDNLIEKDENIQTLLELRKMVRGNIY